MLPSVLLITQRYPPDIGGVATSAARIAYGLAACGAGVDVLAWTRRLPAGKLTTTKEGEVEVHRFGLFRSWDTTMQHTMNALEWLVPRHGISILWGHYLETAGFLAVLFGRLQGLLTTVSARGDDVDRAMLPPGDFARLLWTLEHANLVTAASTDLARKIEAILGRPQPVMVLHNAVDAELFSPGEADASLKERLGIDPGEVVLGFSGELRHKKGLTFMFEALSTVREHRPCCLLVVGEVRPRDESLLAQFCADRPADGARILVTGHLAAASDVAAHLRLMDVFLQPSLWDGLPNAVLEAMACERCVLASDAGGMPDVIESGVNGFLVARSELDRLGPRILEVLGLPPEERAQIGRQARARVIERFQPAAERSALRGVLELLSPSTSL